MSDFETKMEKEYLVLRARKILSIIETFGTEVIINGKSAIEELKQTVSYASSMGIGTEELQLLVSQEPRKESE